MAGGKASDFSVGLKGFPYQNREEYPNLKQFYMFGMGYHIASIFPLIYSNSKKDIVEMMLHHFVTLFLYQGGYLMNILELATFFIWINDIADFPLMLVKVFAESNLKMSTGITFMLTMCIWFYFRMITLATIIYESYTLCAVKTGWTDFMVFAFCFIMTILCMMNHYWFYHFCFIIKKFIQ
jgi:hypothetical protein